MKDECWLRAAISDDRIVAELLLRLKESDDEPSTAAVIKTTSSSLVLPLAWGIRQPRSSVEKSKRDSTPRRSPTTPLSWGCCVGGSGGGGGASPSDGGEDSSSLHNNNSNNHHGVGGGTGSQPSDLRCRSKISASTEPPANTSKRPRRKKTFAELKEEESSLLKERTYLMKELATLRVTLKEQRSINESLKRIKLDLHVESGVKSEANSIEEQNRNRNNRGASEGSSSNMSRQVKSEGGSGPSDSCPAQGGVTSSEEPTFVLPDLNMMPDDDCGVVGLS